MEYLSSIVKAFLPTKPLGNSKVKFNFTITSTNIYDSDSENDNLIKVNNKNIKSDDILNNKQKIINKKELKDYECKIIDPKNSICKISNNKHF